MLSDSRLNLTFAWGLVPSFAKPSWSMLLDAVGERTRGTANVGASAHTSKFIDGAACLGISPSVFQGALGNSSALPQN